MMGAALDRVLTRIEAKKNGAGWSAQCPAHDDRSPSLTITEKNQMVLIHCHAGCEAQSVLVAAGLDWPDLFDEQSTLSNRGVLVATYTYHDWDGVPYMVVERWQNDRGKFFKQRLPDTTTYGLNGTQPCLYRMPQIAAAAERGEEVWIVEGEKCVHAAESLGLTATTAPMGAGKWLDYYAGWLEDRHVRGVNVIVDNDEAGHQHGAAVAVSVRGHGIPVKTWKIRSNDPKADLYDHVLAGYGVKDLVPVRLNRLRPPGTTFADLMDKSFPPITWAVEGILPTGLAILGGPPKVAKSMVALEIALGVACGGRALSELACRHGSVLYLSVDNDSERRLRWRCDHILGETGDSRCLPIEFHTEWPTGEPAIRACQEWVDEERDDGREPLLVVVDTLGKVEPNFEGNGYDNAYLASTGTLSKWSGFANHNNVALLAVHHDRKSNDENDWLNRFTGSRGITATASTLMMIETKRGEPTATLRVTGRDIEADDLELIRSGWSWITHDRPRVPGLRIVE